MAIDKYKPMPGDTFRVTIETKEGYVYSGNVICAELNITQEQIAVNHWGESITRYLPGEVEWDVELRGIGDLEWSTVDEFKADVDRKRTASEWTCDYCGTPNPKKHRLCDRCGGPRSFLYD